LGSEPPIQKLIVEALNDGKTTRSTQLILVETMERAPLAKLPPIWLDALGKALEHADDEFVKQAVVAVRSRYLGQYDGKLDRIVHDPKRSAEARVQAFAALGGRLAGAGNPVGGLLTT